MSHIAASRELVRQVQINSKGYSCCFALGSTLIPLKRKDDEMKTKTERIELRVTLKDKLQIKNNTKMCGLSINEYVTKRAIGYQPNVVEAEALFDFNEKIGEFLNKELTPELELSALKFFDEIYDMFIATHKQTAKEIRQEVMLWQAQDSGR